MAADARTNPVTNGLTMRPATNRSPSPSHAIHPENGAARFVLHGPPSSNYLINTSIVDPAAIPG
jgi:hypothetical protein